MDLTEINGGKPLNADADGSVVEYAPLEAGRYNLECVNIQLNENPEQGKKWEEIEFNIEGTNRKIWHRLNLVGYSDKAVEVAMSSISGMARALGLASVKNTDELVGKKYSALLEVDSYNGKDRNQINPFSFQAVEGVKSESKQTEEVEFEDSDEIPF